MVALAVQVVITAGCAVAPRGDVASWYGAWHHGRPTASGEAYDMNAMTAAHRALPLGTCVEVTHLGTGRRVLVRVNDRGPYVTGRTIDLSRGAARELGMVQGGVAPVRLQPAKPEACRRDQAHRDQQRWVTADRPAGER
jgi:rare lipoprotein A